MKRSKTPDFKPLMNTHGALMLFQSAGIRAIRGKMPSESEND